MDMTVSSPLIAPETPQRTLLAPDAAEALLQQLVSQRWRRLKPEYDDPIGMLMDQGARQWTAGWAPHTNVLYLLVWEADSFKERAWWRLYEDGVLIFEELDGESKTRSALFNSLLESEKLPFLTLSQWLEPMLGYHHPSEKRYATVRALLGTLMSRPEIFTALKEPLFEALEADLGNSEWPVLEVMKIHRLSQKNPLVWLFQEMVRQGILRTLSDKNRLNRALSLLQDDYAYFGTQVLSIFRNLFMLAYDEFQQLRGMAVHGNSARPVFVRQQATDSTVLIQSRHAQTAVD